MVGKPESYLTAREMLDLVSGVSIPHVLISDAMSLVRGRARAAIEQARAQYKQNETMSLANWKRWVGRIADASVENLPEMEELYADIVVPGEALTGLIDRDDVARAKANDNMKFVAGFLHDEDTPDRDLRSYLPERGFVKTLRGIEGDMQGFYSLKTEREEVLRSMVAMGMDIGQDYRRPEQLPARTRAGDALNFAHHHHEYALEVFRAAYAGKLGLPGALVIKPSEWNGLKLRNLGQAKALKIEAYRKLQQMGMTHTLTKIFQIDAVGMPGGPLIPIQMVHNQNSEAINRDLGAEMIATETEVFTRRDGVSLRVIWGLWASRVEELVRRADGEAPPLRMPLPLVSSGDSAPAVG